MIVRSWTRWVSRACVATVVAMFSCVVVAQAFGLWSSSVTVSMSLSTAAEQSAPPVFRVGKSRATLTGGTGPFPHIAHVVGDHAWLDFGLVPEGNSGNSPEVLLIDNPGTRPYALTASLSANIRGLFPLVSLTPEALAPGGTSTLAMKLDTHGFAPGSYEGTLTVSDLFGTFSEGIPVILAIADRDTTTLGEGARATVNVHAKVPPRVRPQRRGVAPKRPASAPEPAPEPVPEKEPVPEPTPEPVPEPTPEPAPEPDPVPEPEPPPASQTG